MFELHSQSLNSLLNKRLLLVTGKGGIGKTLVSIVLGWIAASQGKEVLVAESCAMDQIGIRFGKDIAIHAQASVAQRMSVINLAADDNFREYVTKYLGQKLLYETVLNHKIVKTFFNTIPGLAEAMLLGRLYYFCEKSPRPPDLIILDAPASGHFLSLMSTPDAIISSGLAGPMVKDTQLVRDFLAHGDLCGTIVVTTLEELVVLETLDFLPNIIAKSPTPLAGIVVNRVLNLPDVPLMNKLHESGHDLSLEFLKSRARSSDQALQQLVEGLKKILPKLKGSRSATGLEGLSALSLPDCGFLSEPYSASLMDQLSKSLGAVPMAEFVG